MLTQATLLRLHLQSSQRLSGLQSATWPYGCPGTILNADGQPHLYWLHCKVHTAVSAAGMTGTACTWAGACVLRFREATTRGGGLRWASWGASATMLLKLCSSTSIWLQLACACAG